MKKFLAALLFFAIVFSLCACVSDGENSKRYEESYEYAVMSFNIRVLISDDEGERNWSYRKGEIAKLLEKNSPDIICMQEVSRQQCTDLKMLLKDKFTVAWHARSRGLNPEGVAVLFTDRFSLSSDTFFWLSETPNVQSKGWGAACERIAVHLSLVDKGNDRTLEVFSVHLDHVSQEAKTNGISLVAQKALETDNPAIIAGDFNSTKNSECYKVLSKNFQDCYFATPESFRDEEVPTFNNFGGTANAQTPIDFIFSSKVFVPFESRIITEKTPDNAYYSDHYPVLSKLKLSV